MTSARCSSIPKPHHPSSSGRDGMTENPASKKRKVEVVEVFSDVCGTLHFS